MTFISGCAVPRASLSPSRVSLYYRARNKVGACASSSSPSLRSSVRVIPSITSGCFVPPFFSFLSFSLLSFYSLFPSVYPLLLPSSFRAPLPPPHPTPWGSSLLSFDIRPAVSLLSADSKGCQQPLIIPPLRYPPRSHRRATFEKEKQSCREKYCVPHETGHAAGLRSRRGARR